MRFALYLIKVDLSNQCTLNQIVLDFFAKLYKMGGISAYAYTQTLVFIRFRLSSNQILRLYVIQLQLNAAGLEISLNHSRSLDKLCVIAHQYWIYVYIAHIRSSENAMRISLCNGVK